MAVASVGEKVEEGKLCSRKKRPKVKSMFRIGRDDRTRRGRRVERGRGSEGEGMQCRRRRRHRRLPRPNLTYKRLPSSHPPFSPRRLCQCHASAGVNNGDKTDMVEARLTFTEDNYFENILTHTFLSHGSK